MNYLRRFLPLALVICAFPLQGQLISIYDSDLYFDEPFVGLNVGYGNFSISGFERTLGASLSEAGTYDFDPGNLPSIELGATVVQPILENILYVQLDVDYVTPVSPQDPFKKAHALYTDENELEYAFNAAYQRLHLRPMFGILVFEVLTIKAGLDWGINTTPDALTYDSNDPTIGRDLAIRDELSDKLIGKNHVGFVFSPEATWLTNDFMISLGPMWTYGFSDLVFTQVNNFTLQENPNRLSSLSFRFSAKYMIE